MEEIKKVDVEAAQEQERSSFDFQTIMKAIILNWKWFALSLIICLGLSLIYLRYATPMYQAYAKLLIKAEEGTRGKSSVMYTSNLGLMSNSSGLENEMEILKSRSIAEEAVRDLKLYVTYYSQGKVKDKLLYKNNPISVDMDPSHLETLAYPVNLVITRKKNGYRVEGEYMTSGAKTFKFDKTLTTLPATIGTRVGILTFNSNSNTPMADGMVMKVNINTPRRVCGKYAGSMGVSQTSKSNSIALLTLTDENRQRAVDYLRQLAVCYNRQANEDKNEVALRTEEFINNRLEKINAELGNTEGALQEYKKRQGMIDLKSNAGQALANADAYSKQLVEANTQVALINSLEESVNKQKGSYDLIPANVGLSDPTANQLISKYNEIAAERNRLLRTASESNPTVTPLTAQLDELSGSINSALKQAKRGLEIQRNSIAGQFGKYQGQVTESPEQERMLNQIGRQQEVKSGLYLMLLQKREENSISLAATADKGKLIDEPSAGGQISPKRNIIMLAGLLLGLAIPALIIFLINFFRYKIEGHEDVVKLTKLPILADVAVASDTAKTKADIVVHENQNNQMEEIFRSMRTNLQFVMKENEKVILFTSSTSGEGKTFNAANLSVSFALLGKKVILVGLDIRKPRLAELFEIDDHHHGITPLLATTDPTWEEVKQQILPSGINNNLELLLAGPIPPNPSELVSRQSLEQVVNHLKDHYDYILIDTAPVGLVTDTLQIGRVADATVYMCRADYTPKESFGLINSLADEKKLPNMCIVINGIDMSKKKYGYAYGYGRYGKYGRYGRYGKYGYGSYGRYGSYGNYGNYGNYSNSHYGDKNDTSVKLK